MVHLLCSTGVFWLLFSKGVRSGFDIFLSFLIYGDVDEVLVGKFVAKLKKEIQVFSAKSTHNLKKLGAPLLRNILKGLTIKGSIRIEMNKYAAL